MNANPALNEFNHLEITGTATLGGAIEVLLGEGVAPAGDSFTLMGFASRSGQFAIEDLPWFMGLDYAADLIDAVAS